MTYVMPLSAHDLAMDQRYSTFVHLPGVQGEGKDIGARRRKADGSWPHLSADWADSKKLRNWIVYDKPFYAMASGTVVGGWRNAPENIPGSYHPDFEANKFAGGGNHLWILQNDGIHALYAHAKPGSIPAGLCPHDAALFTGHSGHGGTPDIESEVKITNGAKVKAGQFLGRVGNSGASKGGPHLHVHMEKDGKPVIMPFDRGMTTPFISGIGGIGMFYGPWTKLEGKALPNAELLVWPPRPVGNYRFNQTPAAEYQGLFDHMSDSGMMPDVISCVLNGMFYDVTWVPSHGYWHSHHKMSLLETVSKHTAYTAQGYQRTSFCTCGTVSVAVWRK